MSGICALARLDGTPLDADSIEPMIAPAAHRAVDGVGRWHDGSAAMACLRTRTTTRDQHDRQPLVRGGLVIVADARIDNAEELAPFLMRRGYLATEPERTSDAELILAAHRCWGTEGPARLIGDFAYVIWDRHQRQVVAGRDPMGMRPLYVRTEARRRAILASEIKQILEVPDVPCEIDERSLAATLAGPYLPAGDTLYAGIDEVEPGHLIVARAEGARSTRYWSPRPGRISRGGLSECVDALRDGFRQAVADRISSTRPVGLFLSGGVDSGSIASMAGLLHSRGEIAGPPPAAYSWAFTELPDSDERATSDRIVEHYGLHGRPIQGDDSWPLARYPDHGPDRDDPYIRYYHAIFERSLAQAAADGVGLLLSGDRGDELLGDWVHDEIGLIGSGRIGDGLGDIAAALRSGNGSAMDVLRRTILWPRIEHGAPAVARIWNRRRGVGGGPLWPPWVPVELARRVDLGDLIADATRPARFDGYARSARYRRVFDAQSVRLAVLANRTHARFGIGFADPFADRRLIELVLSLPQWNVQRRRRPKMLMREAMRGIVPEPAHRRLRKTLPTGLHERGVREREVHTVRALLADSTAADRGWLDARAVLTVYEHYVRTGRTSADYWWPLTVEMWLRRWWS